MLFISRPAADVEEWVLGHSAPEIEVRVERESCGSQHAVFRLTCDAGLIRTCRRLATRILVGAVHAGVIHEDFHVHAQVHVHAHVHAHVRVHAHAHVRTCTCTLLLCTCTCTCGCPCTCTCACTCTCTYMYMHLYMDVCTYMHMCMCLYMRMYVCMHMQTHMHMHMYVRVHAHVHVHYVHTCTCALHSQDDVYEPEEVDEADDGGVSPALPPAVRSWVAEATANAGDERHAPLPGGMSPLQVVDMFGNGVPFSVQGCRIVSNRHDDGRWWFAIYFEDFVREGHQVVNLNAHISLFLVRLDPPTSEPRALRMRELLTQEVERIEQRGRLAAALEFTARTNGEVSTDRYAIMNVLVACPAYETLHRLCSVALDVAGCRGRPTFRISVAPSRALYQQR